MASASRVSSLKIFERMKYLYTRFCNLDIQHVLRAQRAVSCASLVCWMKKFFCETVVFGRKILFHPAGSLSFSYCLLSLLAESASTRFLWLKTAAGQPGLGSHAIRSTGSQIKRGVVREVNLLRRKGLVFDRRDHIGGSISNRS